MKAQINKFQYFIIKGSMNKYQYVPSWYYNFNTMDSDYLIFVSFIKKAIPFINSCFFQGCLGT